MAKLPTRDAMKARFWELKEAHAKQRAKADPIRAARDKLAQRHAKEIDAANAKVRKAEEGLGDIEMEMAALVRAVGGRMGEPE